MSEFYFYFRDGPHFYEHGGTREWTLQNSTLTELDIEDNDAISPATYAEAKSDAERDKTSGISIKPITLRCNSQDDGQPPTPAPTIKRRELEVDSSTVEITVWDFAGHGE